MKIEDKRPDGRKVLVGVIVGECFKYNGKVYISRGVQTEDHIRFVSCTNLEDGSSKVLCCETLVEPVSAKVVIE